MRHWLQFWQLRTWIHDNLCYLTINCDTGQHSQFLRCFINNIQFVAIARCLSFIWQSSLSLSPMNIFITFTFFDEYCNSWTDASHLSDNRHFHFLGWIFSPLSLFIINIQFVAIGQMPLIYLTIVTFTFSDDYFHHFHFLWRILQLLDRYL